MKKQGRDSQNTREAILEVAIARFREVSYDRVGVREIASGAGVDAALVNRYFGNKLNLFVECLAYGKGPFGLPRGTPHEQALALADYLCAKPDGVMLIVLRSLGSPDVLPVVQAELEAFLVPLRARLGPARAYMLVTQMVGFLTLRDPMGLGLQVEDLRPWLYRGLLSVLSEEGPLE